jgi:hypothetical protein
VGVLPYKIQNDDFWVSPGEMSCENMLQGELFDRLFEENLFKFSDLQERAI